MSVGIAEFNQSVSNGNLDEAESYLKSIIQEKLEVSCEEQPSLLKSTSMVLTGVYSLTLAKFFEPLKYKLAWLVVDECLRREELAQQ